MKYIITEQRQINKGFYSLTYEVEAESYDEAMEKILEGYVKLIDSEFDIRDSEHMYFESEDEDKEKSNRQFVDDVLYRTVKVPLGIDYPENWDTIVDFCYNDVMEAGEGDFSDMNIRIAFRRFLEQ